MKIIKEANYEIWENNPACVTRIRFFVSNENKCGCDNQCGCDTKCGCDDFCARDGSNEESGVTCTGSVSH